MYNCELEIGSGEVLHQVTDVYLPCAVPVEITRRYASRASASAGLFGWGWLNNVARALTIDASSLVRLDAIDGDTPTELAECDGRRGPALGFFESVATVTEDFTPLSVEAVGRRLRTAAGSELLVLRYPGGHQEVYLPPLLRDGPWRLIRAADPYGNAATYHYSARFLVAVRSCDDREVRLDYEDDRVRQISIHDLGSGGRSLTWVRFEYDSQGNLVSTIDQAGVAYQYEYLDRLLVRFRGPNGLAKYFAYDVDRRCVATWMEGGTQLRRLDRDSQRRQVLVTDSYGRRTLLGFDEAGSLVEHVNALGQTSTRILDGTGAILTSVAPDGSVESTMSYDAENRTLLDFGEGGAPWRRRLDERGRLVQVESPAGSIQKFEYDEHGELVKIAFANGATVGYFYDEKGEAAGFRDPEGYEVRRETSPDGRTVHLRDGSGTMFFQTFDAMDNLLSEVDEGGKQTRFRYRAVDVVAEEIGPSGESTRYEYDEALNLRARTNPLGHTWQIESNALRQVMAEIDPTGGRVTYEYDLECNLVAVVNQRGERMEILRDELYREIGVRHFDGHVVTYELDALGRRTAIIDGRGNRTEIEYGASGNLARRRFADGAVEEYEQNVEGECSSITHIPPPGSAERPRSVTYEHTPLGNVAKEQNDEFQLEYGWDAGAHLVAIRDSLGGETNYVLGNRYRVREIHEGGRRILLRHLPSGEIAEITFPNGLRHAFDYDGSGRMVARTTYSPGGATLTWRRWAYDSDDQLVAMEDWHWGRYGYEYDAAGRLIVVTGPDGQPAEQYAYDETGNLVFTPLGGVANVGPGDRLARASREAFDYDADGNLVGRRDDGQDWRYSWDRDDQLEAVRRDGVEVARFEYDLTNRRRKKHSSDGTRLFLYETYTLRAEVLPNGVVRHYVSLPDLAVPIARWGDEGWFYFSYDQLGTPHEVFDEAGAVVATFHAHAYGGARQAHGPGAASFDLPFGFMGQYRDEEIGLHYNHLRYYDPRHGRFISQDPMGLAMGTNFYVYPANPNNNVDLAGFGPEFHCLKSWTPCQKAYARQKINAVNAAPASRRVKTCTKCRANAQRRDFKSKRCGKNKIGRGRQIDHMHELQAGGPDRCCKNLRAIPKKFNNQLGKQVKKMLKDVGKGKTIMKITKVGCNSDEPCKPEDMAKLAQAPKTQEAQCAEPPLDENC